MSFRMPWEQATSYTSSSSCTTTADNELKPTPVFSRSAANHGWSGFMRRRVLLTSLSFRDLLRTQNLRTHNRTLLPRNEYYNARPEDFSARRRNMVRLVVLAAVAAIAALAMASPTSGQITTGTILGTVTDGT